MGRFQARRVWSLICEFPSTPVKIKPGICRGHDKAMLRTEFHAKIFQMALGRATRHDCDE
jgi:hypothetical protein